MTVNWPPMRINTRTGEYALFNEHGQSHCPWERYTRRHTFLGMCGESELSGPDWVVAAVVALPQAAEVTAYDELHPERATGSGTMCTSFGPVGVRRYTNGNPPVLTLPSSAAGLILDAEPAREIAAGLFAGLRWAEHAPRCSCDPGPNGEHHDYCETNHPHHPCDDRSCRFAPDSQGGGPR